MTGESPGVRPSTIPLRKFLRDGVERTAVRNVGYVLEYGEKGRYGERSDRAFEELSDVFSNFLSVWSGLLDTSLGLRFDFEGKNDPERGRKFFEELKADWKELVERVRKIDFSKTFLIGEERLFCELVYLIFYLNHYAIENGCEIGDDVSSMLNELLLSLSSSPDKLSGLMRHYRNSKMFSRRAYEEVLRRLRRVSHEAYSHHSAECIDMAKTLAFRDFPGVFAFEPLMKIASSRHTIERVLRITKTDVVSDLRMSRDGAEWKIDVFVEEDGVRWGALTVLLILLNDSGLKLSKLSNGMHGMQEDENAKANAGTEKPEPAKTSASVKLLESMLSGDYSFSVNMFFYPGKRKFLSYLNGVLVKEFELDVISKFIEDFTEYVYPAVETLTDRFLEAFERDYDSIPECGLDYDYVVDAVRIRVRKKLATHLEYTCLITKPVRDRYLHFVVLDFPEFSECQRRVFCLACRGENVKPKDAFYTFDEAELEKMFEVVRENGEFRLKPVSFEELKEACERAVEVERKLARIKLKEFGVVV